MAEWAVSNTRFRIADFCWACGRPIQSRTATLPHNAVELDVLLDDALTEATPDLDPGLREWVFLVPNVNRRPPRRFLLDDHVYAPLDGRSVGAEIAWLQQAFAPELAKLNEALGPSVVLWGVLAWTS